MLKIIILNLSLLPVTYFGDTVLIKCQIEIIKALVDNGTHGLIGLITWLIVYLRTPRANCIFANPIWEWILSYFMASAIDIDHFIMTRSLSLATVTKLSDKRPILHCTTLWLGIVSTLLLTAQVLDKSWIVRLAWLIFGSVISHHLRDGIRRGLWLAPFGSTPPIPYPLYLFLLLTLPHLTTGLLQFTQRHLIPTLIRQTIVQV